MTGIRLFFVWVSASFAGGLIDGGFRGVAVGGLIASAAINLIALAKDAGS